MSIKKRIKIWNKWRKGCCNSSWHKLSVLVGLTHSPTFEVMLFLMEDVYD